MNIQNVDRNVNFVFPLSFSWSFATITETSTCTSQRRVGKEVCRVVGVDQTKALYLDLTFGQEAKSAGCSHLLLGYANVKIAFQIS